MSSERTKRLFTAAGGFALGWSLSRMALGQIVGHPQEWAWLTKAHRQRLAYFHKLSALAGRILNESRTVKSVADRAVFSLGCLCWEDLNEAILLFGNGRGIGAMKIVRSLYEHTVTGQYISKRPEEAAAFERYLHIQEHKMVEHLRRNHDVTTLFTKERLAGIEQAFEEVKDTYGRGSWSKKDLLTMANETGDGLERFYFQCYFDPTAHAHATPTATMSRLKIESGKTIFVGGPQRDRASNALFLSHLIVLLAMRTQNEYFNLGMDSELLNHAQKFSALWQRYPAGKPE